MNLDYKEFTEEDKLNSFLFLQDYILNKMNPFLLDVYQEMNQIYVVVY